MWFKNSSIKFYAGGKWRKDNCWVDGIVLMKKRGLEKKEKLNEWKWKKEKFKEHRKKDMKNTSQRGIEREKIRRIMWERKKKNGSQKLEERERKRGVKEMRVM